MSESSVSVAATATSVAAADDNTNTSTFHCRVRWLARAECVARIKKLYGPLLAFFESEKDNNSKAMAIYEWLR